ncbi:MAG: hypothetical protein R3315_09050 [Woeseiaceae bacterium]|nr:hypothetical protein [Woeseiaceae bacterium]
MDELLNKKALVAAIVVAGLLAGCAQVDGWLRGRPAADVGEVPLSAGPEGQTYIDELRELASGDPYTQVEIHADAEAAATLTPNPTTRLRYALVLATPGHAGHDAEAAASLLRDLLAQTEMMTPTEVALATVFLRNVDEQLVLAAEIRRLRSANATAMSAEDRARVRRIADVESENERLRRELADVEQKLEAITSIERSIRAQGENSN